MHPITIFGKQSCGFCRRAKELCEIRGLKFRYVDIEAEGISKLDLEKTVGRVVNTVPQIFHGKEYVGGFEDFDAFVKAQLSEVELIPGALAHRMAAF